MNKQIYLRKTIYSSVILCLMLTWSAMSHAEVEVPISPAIVIDSFDTSNQLPSFGQISASARYGLADSYTDNFFLDYSAWGDTGSWFTFQNLTDTDVKITIAGDPGFVPGATVWATGASEFDGGTLGYGDEFNVGGFGTPISFNATGAMGTPGTLWMASGQGGNMLETLAYAVANPAVDYGTGITGWGETIQAGVHDASSTNTFAAGISGSTDANTIAFQFSNLAAGWYALFIGGTDATTEGGDYDLVISAVPEAQTWAMLLAGLTLIGWRLSRQSTGTSKPMSI